MELHNQTDHIAILSLMLVGTLIKRLDEVGHLDDKTARRLHQLVEGVRIHAKHHGITDLNILFDNIENTLRIRSGGKD
ncbi:MAG: hypothetical protein D6763_01330 [Alphaproteobacteria bacterium]|nr:MAG: hypothetical protein D6763_01330 [Alphaproteobacteria bacterium]